MTVEPMYRYFGANGAVTTNIILDYPHKTDLYRLIAGNGKLLLKNDGTKMRQTMILVDELSLWTEIDEPLEDN